MNTPHEKPAIRPDIMTVSGHYFNLLEPANNTIRVEDIAHALSHVCRFAGHVSDFYSVAQHCEMASRIVPPQYAKFALFHDATEAYIGDVATPLKQLLPAYKEIEARLEADIFAKLQVSTEGAIEVKRADLVMLATEQRDLMPKNCGQWTILAGISPLAETITPWCHEYAKWRFLERYYEICEADAALATTGNRAAAWRYLNKDGAAVSGWIDGRPDSFERNHVASAGGRIEQAYLLDEQCNGEAK